MDFKSLALAFATLYTTFSLADTTQRNIIVCRSSQFTQDLTNAIARNDDKMTNYIIDRKLCEGFRAGLEYEIISTDENGIISLDFLVPSTSTKIRLYSTDQLMRNK